MTLKKFNFNVLQKDNYSRCGLIGTHRGNIQTPAFMPVGTQATVKAVFIDDVIKTGSEIILSNTYHLMLRPGVERIKSVGGLHKFMNCPLPILTDSGGFQVMSLSKFNKVPNKIIHRKKIGTNMKYKKDMIKICQNANFNHCAEILKLDKKIIKYNLLNSKGENMDYFQYNFISMEILGRLLLEGENRENIINSFM